MSDKTKPHRREREAMLYVRQSSTFQMSNNLESQKLQYAMERLRQLGWRDIDIIDDDLLRSAAGTVMRARFERVVVEGQEYREGASFELPHADNVYGLASVVEDQCIPSVLNHASSNPLRVWDAMWR
jgi:hypothetical protein